MPNVEGEIAYLLNCYTEFIWQLEQGVDRLLTWARGLEGSAEPEEVIEPDFQLLDVYAAQGGAYYANWALSKRALLEQRTKTEVAELRESYIQCTAVIDLVELRFADQVDQKLNSELERLISEYERLPQDEASIQNEFDLVLAQRDFLEYLMFMLERKKRNTTPWRVRIGLTDLWLKRVYHKYANLSGYREVTLWVPEEFWWRRMLPLTPVEELALEPVPPQPVRKELSEAIFDQMLTCQICGREFIFTVAEQEFFKHWKFAPPKRCRDCRQKVYRGKVKFYSHEKKYGFIQREGYPDLFFHQSSIIGEKMPERSQEVSFEIIETDRGLQAIKVRSVEPAKYKKKGD